MEYEQLGEGFVVDFVSELRPHGYIRHMAFIDQNHTAAEKYVYINVAKSCIYNRGVIVSK